MDRTLRERCIEAGAIAVYVSKWGPSMSGPKPAGMDFHLSANVLDAILGVLTEHWPKAWEECGECDGKGNKVRGEYRGDTVWMDCPNCLDGLVPPAHQVEAKR